MEAGIAEGAAATGADSPRTQAYQIFGLKGDVPMVTCGWETKAVDGSPPFSDTILAASA